METKMDKKINTFAKIGRILSTIAAVFMIIGAVAVAAGIGITSTLPEDALAVEVTGTADVTAKGDILEGICDAIIDSSKGGDGKIYLSKAGNTNIAVGDVKDSVPEGVTAQKTDKGLAFSVNNRRLDLNVKVVLIALISTLINSICTVVILFIIRALMKAIEKSDTPFCDNVIKKMKLFGYSLIPLAFLSGTSENIWDSIMTLGANVHMGVDLKVVFGILVVFMLVMIFTYGAALQKESDETL